MIILCTLEIIHSENSKGTKRQGGGMDMVDYSEGSENSTIRALEGAMLEDML